jgi:choice-of-anchor C domain-containing protein
MGKTGMKTKLLSVVVSFAFLAVVSPASAGLNLIQNPSFELGVGGDSSFNTLSNGDTSINNWTVGGSIDYILSYWTAEDGKRSLDLNGLAALGSIKQDFTVTNGGKYLVTFWLAGNPDGPPLIKTVGVDVNGEFHTFTFDTTGATLNNMGWEKYFFTFTAIGTAETLKFVSLDCGIGGRVPCSYGAALDNVSVSAVPEASTWVMMLFGFAGVGMMAYRRARKVFPVTALA